MREKYLFIVIRIRAAPTKAFLTLPGCLTNQAKDRKQKLKKNRLLLSKPQKLLRKRLNGFGIRIFPKITLRFFRVKKVSANRGFFARLLPVLQTVFCRL